MKKVLTYLVIALIAFICALNYEIFIFPNSFAPSGLNGICTMIQHIWGISLGYLSLLINVPLAILVYFKVSRALAMRSMVYVLSFSISLLLLDNVDFSAIAYETSSSAILGPLVAGIIFGGCYSLLLKASAYSGGTDFIAALIHKKRPELNTISLILALNVVVALLSFFVYGYKMEPVILCILYCFTSSTVSDRLMKNGRSAIRFEIITNRPEEISDAIIHKLHHSATLIPAKGMYLGRETNILICVVNRTQAAKMTALIRSFPDTFAVVSHVGEVMGNFKHLQSDGKEEKALLDHGDAQIV